MSEFFDSQKDELFLSFGKQYTSFRLVLENPTEMSLDREEHDVIVEINNIPEWVGDFDIGQSLKLNDTTWKLYTAGLPPGKRFLPPVRLRVDNEYQSEIMEARENNEEMSHEVVFTITIDDIYQDSTSCVLKTSPL